MSDVKGASQTLWELSQLCEKVNRSILKADLMSLNNQIVIVSLYVTHQHIRTTCNDIKDCPSCVAGVGAIVTFGLKGSLDADLPITKAPTKTENGKGGSVRSRI